MRFFFEILLQSQKDLDKIMVISEEYDFDIEVLNRADGKAYLIKFESKYQEYECALLSSPTQIINAIIPVWLC